MKSIKKILLIRIPAVDIDTYGSRPIQEVMAVQLYPTLGVMYLASSLISSGLDVQVEILDAYLEGTLRIHEKNEVNAKHFDDVIREKIEAFKPDVVGVSCLVVTNHKQAQRTAKVVKEIRPNAVVVMGGGYPTLLYDRVLGDKNIDYVIIGEGDRTFVELLECVDSKSVPSKIDGVAYRKDNTVIVNPKTRYIEDLDSIPFPARDLMPVERYPRIGGGGAMFSMITSRACPQRCIFCGSKQIWGKRYRSRSAENVLKEIEELVTKRGAEKIDFIDDNLTLQKDRAEAILDGIIERGLKFNFGTPNAVYINTLDRNLLKKMKQAGCDRICLAIESGSQYVLDNIVKKGIDLKRIPDIVRMARDLGLRISAAFMAGFPGETKEQIQETFDFARKMRFDWNQFSIATPFPGTEMYRICDEKGYLTDKAYDLSNLRYGMANIRTPDFDEDYIKKETYKANLEINFFNNYNLTEGNADIAVEDFSRVVDLYPQHAIAHYSLGRAFMRKGLTETAIDELNKAVKINPELSEARELLSSLNSQKGITLNRGF